MNPVPLFLIIVTLPLLLGGCGEKHEGVNLEELEIIGDALNEIAYHKGSPYTGKRYGLHLNGQKSMEGNYKDGKEDGLWVWWYKNGQKSMEGNYKNGKAVGLHVNWYENGQKMLEQNFIEDEGENFPIIDGLEVGWHENGQKSKEGNYKDGKPVGLHVEWYENGQKKLEQKWKEGNIVKGSSKFWNSKGEPVDSILEVLKE